MQKLHHAKSASRLMNYRRKKFYRSRGFITSGRPPAVHCEPFEVRGGDQADFPCSWNPMLPVFFSGWRSADQGRQPAFPPAPGPGLGGMAWAGAMLLVFNVNQVTDPYELRC